MRVTKAIITAAGRRQRLLPLQTLIDRDGESKSVLRIIVQEAQRAGIEQICVVVCPGDEEAYAKAAGAQGSGIVFVQQQAALGYGHAIYCAHRFAADDPFLHLVGDHLYVSREAHGCAQQLVSIAEPEACAVSAVQASHESLLPYFGTVGGRRLPGKPNLYLVEDVVEKPTPTEAEQRLMVPGLRAGHYLCFFGMHVLMPTVMDILARNVQAAGDRGGVDLSSALAELATRERYLALERLGWRYDVGVKYGLLRAQLALALSGQDRDEVLTQLLDLVATLPRNSHSGFTA